MSGYEVEHNISPEEASNDGNSSSSSRQRWRRPDLSSFYAALEQLDTSNVGQHHHNNPHAVPMPDDISALFALFCDALQRMSSGRLGPIADLIQTLSDDPPRQISGVPDSFLDELERVPKKELKPEDECTICRAAFLDDPHPLVVELPCDARHRFDLDCIRPWLKLSSTCPLDRKSLIKERPPPPLAAPDDDEWDDDQFA